MNGAPTWVPLRTVVQLVTETLVIAFAVIVLDELTHQDEGATHNLKRHDEILPGTGNPLSA